MQLSNLLMCVFVVMVLGCVPQSERDQNAGSHTRQIVPVKRPNLNSQELRLNVIPKLELTGTLITTCAQKQIIQGLIRDLAQTTRPSVGYSSTSSGRKFSPLGFTQKDAVLQFGNETTSPDGMKELVKAGPAAIPFLLDSLDDDTKTKIRIEGTVYFGDELSANPINPIEQSVLQARPAQGRDFWENEPGELYEVKVGDLCFVILGEIVGRDYQAVRYQPTEFIIVNSPVRNATLCAEIRRIWASPNSNLSLFESLLFDYSTEGIFNGNNLEGWDIGSNLQIEAARRLLYYYPEDSTSLIAKRLSNLKVYSCAPSGSFNSPKELIALTDREVANGIRTVRFIDAVAWSNRPLIVKAIADISNKTDDHDIKKVISSSQKSGD